MITPSFSLTATERVLPKLALDFTTAALDPRVTFTRTTGALNPATYINSSGVITAATNNQPRFDYDPVALVCKGLLVEETRTNLAVYSDDLTQLAWTKSGVTINSNAIVSPDGTQNADEVVEDLTASSHSAYLTFTGRNSNETLTYSVFVKKGSGTRWLRFNVGNNANSWFDPNTGTWGTVAAGYTASVTTFSGGWYRVSLTGVTGATTVYLTVGLATANNNSAYAGNGTSSLYIWGAQLEAGAFATSYIPTTTAALTRNADVATMTGTNFSDWFNASEGTFSVQANVYSLLNTTGNPGTLFAVSDGTTNNRIRIITTSSGIFDGAVSGASQFALGASYPANTLTTVCGSYATNNFKYSRNASAVLTDTSGTVPTVSQMEIGSFLTGRNMNGIISQIKYWPISLTTSEIQSFSKG